MKKIKTSPSFGGSAHQAPSLKTFKGFSKKSNRSVGEKNYRLKQIFIAVIFFEICSSKSLELQRF